jgi:hypothetical protein
MTGTSAAKSSSIFISSCSQFIVEYAGDFMTQDQAGTPTVTAPDGITDYVVVPGTGGAPERRLVQWYGFPRDTSGNPLAGPDQMITAGSGDVVPVQTLYPASLHPCEKQLQTPANDYIAAWRAGDFDGTDALYTDTKPRKPTMIRIIIQIADSAGRLTDGQNFEYVFAVK